MTKLPHEKTDEELNASVKVEVKGFFEKTKADARAKQEKPYLMYPHVKLRQVVQAMQDEKRAASKKNQHRHYHTMSVLSQRKSRRTKGNRRRPGQMLHSSANKHSNQCHH
jgi:alpha-acetolactate decarboxylase